jgi:hypothetical protein
MNTGVNFIRNAPIIIGESVDHPCGENVMEYGEKLKKKYWKEKIKAQIKLDLCTVK